MIELIPLTIGVEQNFTLSYNDIDYDFNMRFSDYGKYWFVDIKKQEVDSTTGEVTPVNFIVGLKLPVDVDALRYFGYLNMGKLALVDTNPDSTEVLNAKKDLGDRLKLYRSI